ncbi:cob(I)yrinic acid a,c-diamide adenosyltransferase, partial [uncultured Bartonella sp.]|uniref:cob(I)yrinic acid a,c-diamide adenosyltransferase n=1 Tax=uncultured Bartonella sp. TaxID=104108 RepID=UPI00261E2DE5
MDAKDKLNKHEINARHSEKMKKKEVARKKIEAGKTQEKGLLIVHTGKGKGKTTAAFGMVFRALGQNMKVGVVQFVKGLRPTGERLALEKFGDQVRVYAHGEGFTWE